MFQVDVQILIVVFGVIDMVVDGSGIDFLFCNEDWVGFIKVLFIIVVDILQFFKGQVFVLLEGNWFFKICVFLLDNCDDFFILLFLMQVVEQMKFCYCIFEIWWKESDWLGDYLFGVVVVVMGLIVQDFSSWVLGVKDGMWIVEVDVVVVVEVFVMLVFDDVFVVVCELVFEEDD